MSLKKSMKSLCETIEVLRQALLPEDVTSGLDLFFLLLLFFCFEQIQFRFQLLYCID